MCLDTVDEKLTVPKEGVGWRKFRVSYEEPGLRACFQGNDEAYPTRVWLKEGDYRDADDKGQKFLFTGYLTAKYPYGFHIFKARYAAEKDDAYAVRKVLYRKAVASGTQNGCKVIVAKEMKIL